METATQAQVATGSSTSAGRPLPLWYSLLLATVLVVATGYGLLVAGAYPAPAGVRPTLPETLRGQDVVTLLAAVVLVWAARRARSGSLAGHIVWLSILLYVAYTYLMYVVAPYNDALVLYIAAIGLSVYGFLDGLFRLDGHVVATAFADMPRRGVAWFLLVVGTLFATLWLTDILAVWPGGAPASLFVYDIPSTVHVLDLAIILPLLLLSGIWLLRGHPIAPVLAAIALVKMLTLGLALLSMSGFVLASNGTVDPAEPVLWTVVVALAGAWLVRGARRMRPVEPPWLRASAW